MVMLNYLIIWLVLLCLPLSAEAVSAWQLTGSANISFSGYQNSQRADSQSEFSAFVDGQYLDGLGIGAGYISQDRNLSASSSLVNNIIYLGAWKTFYTDVIPGKLTMLIDSYTVNGDGSVVQGTGKGSSATTQVDTDDFDAINPTLVYTSASKSLSFELSYARSRLFSDTAGQPDVIVKQWAPALALYINDRYDRLYLKHYSIDLSNDSRAVGVTSTTAVELKWTHWYQAGGTGLRDMTIAVLTGQRLYGIDHETRRVDSFPEILTGRATVGATWGLSERNAFYAYVGLERYKDAEDGSKYTAAYSYLGVRKQW